VGELQSIGYHGQPVQQAFRRVDPPVTVLVEGRLTCWGICEQGYWWGLVTYEIAYGPRRKSVTHWIPAWMLKRKTE
jgi:hypothetical protein